MSGPKVNQEGPSGPRLLCLASPWRSPSCSLPFLYVARGNAQQPLPPLVAKPSEAPCRLSCDPPSTRNHCVSGVLPSLCSRSKASKNSVRQPGKDLDSERGDQITFLDRTTECTHRLQCATANPTPGCVSHPRVPANHQRSGVQSKPHHVNDENL